MVLLSDGYQVYAQYAEAVGIALAQCWSHTRRGFERAKDIEPEAAAEALERIGVLYRVEAEIRDRGLTGEAKRAYRQAQAKPAVEAFFAWAEAQLERAALLPSNPLTKALHYALERREALSLYLDDPDVPIDTNHLERALRPIPMGRNYVQLRIMRCYASRSLARRPKRRNVNGLGAVSWLVARGYWT